MNTFLIILIIIILTLVYLKFNTLKLNFIVFFHNKQRNISSKLLLVEPVKFINTRCECREFL